MTPDSFGSVVNFEPITSSKRIELIVEAKMICQKCHKITPPSKLHIHHIVQRSKGGSNDKSNLIVVCRECHGGLHNNDYPTIESGPNKIVSQTNMLIPYNLKAKAKSYGINLTQAAIKGIESEVAKKESEWK